VKTLYTVTRIATTRLDYASPLLSAEAREALGGGPATFSLNYVDTQVGTGDLVKRGKWLTAHYTGYLATDGTKFDSSHDHPGGQPISFPYGQHQVIEGWDTGFEGMKMGGKRRLFIPYQLAYGETGKGPIPAKSELVFDVELISQSDTRPAPPPGARPPGRPGLPPAGSPPATKIPPTGTPPAGASRVPGATTPKPAVTPPPGTTPGAPTPPNGASTPPPTNPQTPPPGTGGTTPPSGSSTPQP
jgi:peptidylprolyl isomerase